MPNRNIECAIRRGASEGGEAANYQEMVYEAKAPGVVTLIIEATPDNKNRTAAKLRLLFSKYEQAVTQVVRLSQVLEDGDDAQNVHSNFDAPKELLAKAG